jgi:hypothetical protein
MSNNVNLYKLAGILDSGSAGQILTSDGAGNFSFATLEIPPSGLDSANVIALQTPQDFAYSSLTGTPNVLDSSNVSTLITTAVDALVAGAPAALDTLNELAIALNDDSNAIAAITNTLTLKLNIADVVPQDFAYASLTGTPNVLDSADVIALSPPQDFAYASLTGTPNILDSANVISIHNALGGVDSAAITSMIDSNYVSSRVTLAYAGNASVENIKFVADSGQTIFNGLSYSDQLVQVYLNGVLLLDSDDYVKSGNDTITLTQAATIGDQLVVSDFTAFFTNTTVTAATINGLIDSALSNVGIASITDTKFIADSAQTIFTGLSFNDQLIQVHLNGVLLIDSDDYVKSGNDTITTTYGLNIGDQLVVSDFTAFFSNTPVAVIPQDFAYASLTGAPNILDSAAVTSIASALGGGVDSAAITSMIDSAYVQARAPSVDLSAINQSIIPNTNATYDIGSASYKIRDLYLSNNSLHIGENILSVNANKLLFNGEDVMDYASLTGAPNILDSAEIIALSPPQDFAYASLTGAPTLFDGAYSSLTGTPNILDSANVTTLITTAVDALVGGAPAALDTLNELATQLNNDSDAIAAITNTLALKLNIADVVAQDFAYASLTGTPTLFDGAYSSLTGTPTILDSAAVSAIAGAGGGGGGGVDSAQLATEITQQLALLDIADIINDDGNPGDALVSTGNGGAEWSDIKATIRQKAIAMALLFRA